MNTQNTVTLNVPEIHCGHCKSSIEGAVGELAGVSSVLVDIEATSVDVTFGEPVELSAIVTAIEDIGYEVPDQD